MTGVISIFTLTLHASASRYPSHLPMESESDGRSSEFVIKVIKTHYNPSAPYSMCDLDMVTNDASEIRIAHLKIEFYMRRNIFTELYGIDKLDDEPTLFLKRITVFEDTYERDMLFRALCHFIGYYKALYSKRFRLVLMMEEWNRKDIMVPEFLRKLGFIPFHILKIPILENECWLLLYDPPQAFSNSK